MDVLRIVGGLFLLNCLLSYFITNDSVLWGYRPWFVRPAVLMRYLVSPNPHPPRQQPPKRPRH
jgi:hypothetical protein